MKSYEDSGIFCHHSEQLCEHFIIIDNLSYKIDVTIINY